MKALERIHSPSRGVESLSKEEHGRFFDAVQRLGLSNEVKQASIALYLDFKSRPIGEYNADHKNLEIFLIASISLAAKAIGDLRTDQEFETRMFVSREKLVDAEERIIKSFGVQGSIMPLPQIIFQLTRRQIEIMAESFSERGLLGIGEKEELVERSYKYLDELVERALVPKMSYRGRAAGVMLNAVRDLGLQLSELDIAKAAGFDKKSVTINANVIATLLREPKASERKDSINYKS